MQGIVVFILVFGIIVTIHEFGHFYFAKRSGILVREFAIGMGPKVFSHHSKDGTTYTVRILPVGGYVRMAGWGDDETIIKTGTPASLTFNDLGLVSKINLSSKKTDPTATPMNITCYDLEDKLVLEGQVLGESRKYSVDHDAMLIEADGTEVRIAPLDVQYQNASVFGKLVTNFAGPMNNFILGFVIFTLLAFMRGGVPDYDSNQVQVVDNGALYNAGIKNTNKILSVENIPISNWEDLSDAVAKATDNIANGSTITLQLESDGKVKKVEVTPVKDSGRYLIGVRPVLKTNFMDKILGGMQMTWQGAMLIVNALRGLIAQFSLNKLGGPVAMFQQSNQVSKQGIDAILEFMAMISINIGIFNLIPIPALDGGKIVINILEMIRRKPLKQETETYITFAGVIVMLILMVAVTWNDIIRAFF